MNQQKDYDIEKDIEGIRKWEGRNYAFPQTIPVFREHPDHKGTLQEAGKKIETGITILDYFAAKALQGLIANRGFGCGSNDDAREMSLVKYANNHAEEAYMIAQAMVLERKNWMEE